MTEEYFGVIIDKNNGRYVLGKEDHLEVTKQDIANHLGISRTAVSLALNHSPKCTLSKKTQEKIFETARELGYPFQRLGESSKKICFALFNVNDKTSRSTNSTSINWIDDYVGRLGYNLVYMNVSGSDRSLKRFFDYVESKEAAGLVIFGLTDISLMPQIRRISIPYIIFSELEGEWENCCSPDTCSIMKQAVKKLISYGHQRIALFALPLEFQQQRNILRGYRETLEEAGIDFEPSLVQVSSTQDGEELAARMEYLNIPYTAAICANPTVQFGALNWLRQHGIRVPEQKSLVSYGMNDLVMLSNPKLSVFYLDEEDWMKEGMVQLFKGMEEGRKDYPCRWMQQAEFFEGGTIGRCYGWSNEPK